MTDSTPPLPAQASEAFPYRVEQQAGAGAVGVVYRARDLTLDRTVAIKVLKVQDADDESRQRFHQEARAAAALAHPGVTTVYRVGEVQGRPYIVMEWLDGPTLDQLIRADGPLPVDRAGSLALQLLDALDAAHGVGIVHRDLKPSNLVLVNDSRLKVTDFGIARFQGRELVKTVAGQVLATPQFASPEQLEGRKVDGRSDLFSAASVVYYLLTGTYPFEGRDLGQLLTAVLTKKPVPLVQRDARLPAALDAWLGRAMAKRPEERFGSAHEMAESLRSILEPGTAVAASANNAAPTTLLVAPPAQLAVLETPVPGPAAAIVSWVAQWGARQLGELDRDALLDKLLEDPLYADPFAGVARFGDVWLFVERGILLAVVKAENAWVDREGHLPDRAPVRIHPAPSDLPAGTVTLLASAICPGTPRLAGLASDEVNLPAFVSKRLDEGFTGSATLRGADRALAVLTFQAGRLGAVVAAGPWAESPNDTEWGHWLASARATLDLYDRRLRPPTAWFRRGFSDVSLRVVPPAVAEEATSNTTSLTLSAVLGTTTRSSAAPLFRLEGAVDGLVPLADAPIARFTNWVFDDLPRLLVEQRRSAAWKYLGDWLLIARRARLHTQLERPGTARHDTFDLVTEDADGKALHLGHRLAPADAEGFKALVERVIAAKQARADRGDVGGVFVVAPSFDDDVIDAYRQLFHKGWGNKLFALDRSMGYEGFVRLGARRGFHLLLVEETDDGFRPLFEAGGTTS